MLRQENYCHDALRSDRITVPKISATSSTASTPLGREPKEGSVRSGWRTYVDDLTVRTGRVLDGVFYSDAEHEARKQQTGKI